MEFSRCIFKQCYENLILFVLKTYVVKVVSTLSSRTHDIVTTTATVKADADLQKKHIKLKFEAKVYLVCPADKILLPNIFVYICLPVSYEQATTTRCNTFHRLQNSG